MTLLFVPSQLGLPWLGVVLIFDLQKGEYFKRHAEPLGGGNSTRSGFEVLVICVIWRVIILVPLQTS